MGSVFHRSSKHTTQDDLQVNSTDFHSETWKQIYIRIILNLKYDLTSIVHYDSFSHNVKRNNVKLFLNF